MIVLVRRIVVISVVVLALLTCGVVVALAAWGDESTPISKTQAEAFAQAVNLRATDLPGSASLPKTERVHDGSNSFFRCNSLDKAQSRSIYSEGSLLVDNDWFVGSDVLVKPSGAVAQHDVAALSSRRAWACLAHRLGESFRVDAAKKYVSFAIKATSVSVPKLLGQGAIGIHVLAELPAIERPKPLFIDVTAFFFRVGPADIILLTNGVRQFPSATQRRLLSLLHSRAEAHKL